MKKILTILLLLTTLIIKAQDPNFSSFGNNPLYYNPATPGMTEGFKIRMNYRNLWPGIAGTFQTYKVESDVNINPLHTGIGFLAMSDVEGEGSLRTSQAGVSISPFVNLTRNSVLSFGLMAYYVEKTINWNKLEFDDQYDKIFGKVYNTSFAYPGTEKKTYPDFSSGLLYRISFKNKASAKYSFLNIGLAAHHITRPNQSLVGTDMTLDPKFVIHSNFMSMNTRDGGFGYSPGFIYENQSIMETFTVGTNILRGPIFGGFWVRNKNFKLSGKRFDSMILSLGLISQTNDGYVFKLGYSYDVTISRLMGGTYGSHEIFLSYEINQDLFTGKGIFSGKISTRKFGKQIRTCPPGFEY